MLTQKVQTSTGLHVLRLSVIVTLIIFVSGCEKLGPDFTRPEVDVQQDWIEAESAKFKPEEVIDNGLWWTVFDDPVLNKLIETSYQQNLSLKVAGIRILEARAQLGIAVGNLYPQQQQASAGVTYSQSSRNVANTAGGDLNYWGNDIGFSSSWELDFWGRFARGIESADANLLVSVASYDDLLVSLTSQVATTYFAIRTFEERIAIAQENIKLQQRGLELSEVSFRNGAVTELDVNQAETLLRGTQSSVPGFKLGRSQSVNALATLLGITPYEASRLMNDSTEGIGVIPNAPVDVAVGIPADLLRRRPDVRLAELQAWSQSALIGVAKADLYPSFSLTGTIGISASDSNTSRNGNVNLDDIFKGDSLRFHGGPGITWNIFNFGRIKNNVRVQDARFQQLIVSYQNQVLQAGQEVENAMVGFLQTQSQAEFLRLGVEAAKRSVEISLVQYGDGATDYTTVLDTQRSLVSQQDQYTTTRGSIVQNLVAMYRALGGGWQIREGHDFVSEETQKVMRERTDWGELLEPEALENILPPDEAGETLRKP